MSTHYHARSLEKIFIFYPLGHFFCIIGIMIYFKVYDLVLGSQED